MKLPSWTIPVAAAVVGWALLAVVYHANGVNAEKAKESAAALVTSRVISGELRDSLHRAVDSLARTKAKVDTLWKAATVYVERSNSFGRAADSLTKLAPADTAHACTLVEAALDARTSECEQLRAAVALDSQAIHAGQSQLAATEATLIAAQARTVTLDSTLKVVTKPYTCRLFWFVPCPSRGLALLVGAGLLETARLSLTGKP